jgi:hypothetical protein
MSEAPLCSFAGYVSEARRQLVQEWYDGLPVEERDEIKDTANYLQSLPITSWQRPEYDKVTPPLHEIGCKANVKNHWIRIYGVWDKKIRGRFVMLLGNESKKKGYDKEGQGLALKRFALLEQGKGSTHEFVFEKKPSGSYSKK